MVSRKKAAGKARRAAKVEAKARDRDREEAREREREGGNPNETTINESEELLEDQMQQVLCWHGVNVNPITSRECICFQFVQAFAKAIGEADRSGGSDRPRSLSEIFNTARNATMDEYAEMWNDSAMIDMAMSYFLGSGARHILSGNYDHAGLTATTARYLEQHIAVYVNKTQALHNWPKMRETANSSDLHTLVKFFRHRIPCSCLDEIYKEVKNTTKMSICFNLDCNIPYGEVERSRIMCCGRCRIVTYCSRECQKVCWTTHKPKCDRNAAIIARFEAEQQEP